MERIGWTVGRMAWVASMIAASVGVIRIVAVNQNGSSVSPAAGVGTTVGPLTTIGPLTTVAPDTSAVLETHAIDPVEDTCGDPRQPEGPETTLGAVETTTSIFCEDDQLSTTAPAPDQTVDLCDTTPPYTADPSCENEVQGTAAGSVPSPMTQTTAAEPGADIPDFCRPDSRGATTSSIKGRTCPTVDICDLERVSTTDPNC